MEDAVIDRSDLKKVGSPGEGSRKEELDEAFGSIPAIRPNRGTSGMKYGCLTKRFSSEPEPKLVTRF
ncbi:MAG: hypothetical protein DRJ61_06890 [Acidobacteria bacterium]|nr:MAG: hypothetical protein DRJ61_06890 [Acidobacteriota bacterium]